jgi:TorA maturation chaperone TorD
MISINEANKIILHQNDRRDTLSVLLAWPLPPWFRAQYLHKVEAKSI